MPASLSELRVWFVGGAELARALVSSSECTLDLLEPDDWRRHIGEGEPPHFILVEGREQEEASWAGELDALLDSCKQASIPRLLWITSSPVHPSWLERCGSFDRVFTIDSAQLPGLDDAGAVAPSPLWGATDLGMNGSDVARADERPDPVVWLGGWSEAWPDAWRERLAAVLQGAASLGLLIVRERDLDGLPSELRSCVEARDGEDRARILSRAKVAIGADPGVGSHHVASPAIFDATACAAAVVTPHAFAYYGAFSAPVDGELRDFIPCVRDAESAAAAIDRFLTDAALREEAVSRCRQIVSRNHTYSHRLATLASAANIPVLPQ